MAIRNITDVNRLITRARSVKSVMPLLPLAGVLMGIDCCPTLDPDGDGWTWQQGDCNVFDGAIHPDALEVCDGLDNNCDGGIDEGFDADGDGLADCFDTEVCDGMDNNGDGQIDEGFDEDGDGDTVCASDCDDFNPEIYGGAPELCDGLDNDCDGVLPEEETDGDGDGFWGCEGDCDDADPNAAPGASELCDGLDNDCDGVLPEEETDGDGDGFWECEGDCDDADPDVFSGAHEDPVDGVDNDCDGTVDELPKATLYTMVTPCTLTVIDTAALTVTPVGTIGAGGEDFTFSSDGRLYSSADQGYCGVHGSADALYTVDLVSGSGTLVGGIGYGDVDAIAFAPDGTLYASDAYTDQLLRIDPATGLGTVIGSTGFPFIGGMDFSPDGVLYATDISGGGGGPSTLLTLDTEIGLGTAIGPVGYHTVEGIAFAADGTLFGISDFLGGGTGELIVIDLETGTGVGVMPVITSGYMDGLAALPSSSFSITALP